MHVFIMIYKESQAYAIPCFAPSYDKKHAKHGINLMTLVGLQGNKVVRIYMCMGGGWGFRISDAI